MRILIALLLSAFSVEAATLAQLRTRVDAWLADKWPIVVSRQETYFGNHGRYWQGLLTHTNIPAHTTASDSDSVADRLTTTPNDQTETWLNVFAEWQLEAFPAAVKVDAYDGPDGKGFVATIFIRHNGTLYSRSQAVGPETWATRAWRVVTE